MATRKHLTRNTRSNAKINQLKNQIESIKRELVKAARVEDKAYSAYKPWGKKVETNSKKISALLVKLDSPNLSKDAYRKITQELKAYRALQSSTKAKADELWKKHTAAMQKRFDLEMKYNAAVRTYQKTQGAKVTHTIYHRPYEALKSGKF